MMLRTFLLATILTVAQSGYSQLEKGNFLIGGSLGYSESKINNPGANPFGFSYLDQRQINFSISPNVSYFIIEKLSLGLMPSYVYSKNSIPNSTETNTNTLSIGPVVRYYFPFGPWAVFPEVSYSVGSYKLQQTHFTFNSNLSNSAKSNSFKAGLGVTYFLTKSVGVEAKIFYQKNDLTYDNTYVSNGAFSLYSSNTSTSSWVLNVGLQVYLSKKTIPATPGN